MKLDADRLVITLQHRQSLPLETKSPAELSCISGTLWLTTPSDAGDHLLEPLDTISIASNDRVVVQALGTTQFCIVSRARWSPSTTRARRLITGRGGLST